MTNLTYMGAQSWRSLLCLVAALVGGAGLFCLMERAARAGERRPLPAFERVVIDNDFPGGYQVEVADVNGDGRPDVIGVGGGTCAWYENPSWQKRIVSTPRQTPGIISSATADLDGDGKAEVAIAYQFGMNEPTHGKLVLAVQDAGRESAWTLKPVADVGSIHRLRWGEFAGKGKLSLAIAPIFGPDAKAPTYDQSPAKLVVFHTGAEPLSGRWTAETVGERPVVHGIRVFDWDGDGRSEILSADNLGVALFSMRPGQGGWQEKGLVPGAKGEPPKRGSSEIHVGKLATGRRFLATIDPWHGSQVSVWLPDEKGNFPLDHPNRTVIDDTLSDGHALWVADVDGDGDDEIFAGHRGTNARVSAYDFEGKAWKRTVLDEATAAQDLRGADLDGDGTPDVVAIGGKTHNVVWYRPRSAAKPSN